MENKKFSNLESLDKKIISDTLSFYESIKNQKIVVSKQKDFTFEEELVLMDDYDKKTISILFGLLNGENIVSNYLSNKHINKGLILSYLGIEEVTLIPIHKNNFDLELLNIFKTNLSNELDIIELSKYAFKKFESNSDIVYSMYYSNVSQNRVLFNEIKEDLNVLKKINQINNLEFKFDYLTN